MGTPVSHPHPEYNHQDSARHNQVSIDHPRAFVFCAHGWQEFMINKSDTGSERSVKNLGGFEPHPPVPFARVGVPEKWETD